MSEITYYKKNRDIILNRAKEYYKNNKEDEKDIKKTISKN